jgi:hypothetical protein
MYEIPRKYHIYLKIIYDAIKMVRLKNKNLENYF